ncbi:MAG: valine--tRNA ligase [Lachnospiraceae bacterium]|nr:valine--tRNA ligase [Lachnospiraceae bacterium]
MSKELEKNYNPADIEQRLYDKWIQNKYFHAEVDRSKKPFTIVMPPPNITGQLHMGHALDNTIQDILIRTKRMQGYEALWVPGTDHASIATEAKIVEKMREEGVTKEEIGREKFLERAWEWKKQYGGRIVAQLKKMGSSCDWDRERFTMDEGCNKAVKEVFVNLYNKGQIYRGERIINWCPKCLTSISDAEVEYEDQAGHFWHLRYQLSDGSGYINLATTRPETLLGDTAVAVNPNDDRYKDMVGKTVILPIVHREIPIVADDYVEMDFGTGVVKITPAHDPNDFEVGLRHNLPVINVMTDDAKIVEDYPKYAGMDRYEARKAIVADLEAEGALIKIEDYSHNVGTCYRCHTTIEPRVSKQWFVKMEELAKPAIEAVKNEDTKFIPPHFDKTYYHWLENIRDWCISRQLWWGHRIPAFYCDDCGEMVVTKENTCKCPKCGKEMRQDPDTLDTWFSSALWPFSTLGWPDKTEELDYFYPTSVLVTGYDIIFFWVIRMMFSGLEHAGEVPFKNVLIHGLVRDSQGRKMSKSLGNGIDPLEVIEQYGADALRFTLITGNAPGNDMRFYYERVEASRNFANKVWNASRFIMMNMPEDGIKEVSKDSLTQADKWILSKANKLVKDVTDNIEKFELGVAADKLYNFIWEEFCDWYIEMVKPRLYSEDNDTKSAALYTLKTVLETSLKLLHPYMPFVTEEIYCTLNENEDTLMTKQWPEYTEEFNFAEDEEAVEIIKEAVRNIRNVRAGMNVPPSKKALCYVVTENDKVANIFRQSEVFFGTLAYASEVKIQADKAGIEEDAVSVAIANANIYMPFAELVDIEKEIERLKKEEDKLKKEIERVEKMLSNEKFISKAPQSKVDEEKEKQVKYTQLMKQVKDQLAHLTK